MPRGDGTGPLGQGPKTGRGMGPCGNASNAGFGVGQGQVGGRFSRFCNFFRRRNGGFDQGGGRGNQGRGRRNNNR